jgi:hypothetical protein
MKKIKIFVLLLFVTNYTFAGKEINIKAWNTKNLQKTELFSPCIQTEMDEELVLSRWKLCGYTDLIFVADQYSFV